MINFKRIDVLFNMEKGVLQSSKNIPGKYDFITASAEWKTHKEYSHECEALIFAAAASGSLGRTHYINGKFVSSDLCIILTPKDNASFPIDLEFYHILFNSIRESIVKDTKSGTSKESIGLNSLGKYELPYYDIEYQKKVRTAYQQNQEINKEFCHEFITQLNNLDLLRQAFLKEAMQGKLVPQDPEDEPASELLKRIKAEKAQLIKEKKLKPGKELPPIKPEEIPYPIPDTWTWCRLGDIAQHNSGKTLDSGRNSGELREYITTSNLYWGFFDMSSLKKMPIQDHELDQCTAKKDDLLICEGGEAGRAAVWSSNKEICFQNHIHRVRFYCNVNPYYVFRYFEKINYTGEINDYRKGMGISNLSGKSLSSIIIPLPPISEQKLIVDKLNNLMHLCDELKTTIEHSKELNDRLLKATLREALTSKN